MNREKVLLLGNGVNRIGNNYSWQNLMDDVLDFVGLLGQITVQGKPFPLLYESLLIQWSGKTQGRELVLKKTITKLLQRLEPNELHREILGLPVQHILTTNYDYNLEESAEGGLRNSEVLQPVKGNKYSLLRRRTAGDKIIWHIHGDVNAAGSILLGYEQYAGYLQNIRNYVMMGIHYKDSSLPPLNARLKDGDDEIRTWIDHFFMNDIYILGLDLNFEEIHLWWLLAFRARLLNEGVLEKPNRIIYIFPDLDDPNLKPRIDLFCTCKVECMPVGVPGGNWRDMYRHALEYIRMDHVEK